MWCCKRPFLLCGAVLVLAIAVAGCGFRPIHGSVGQGQAHRALADVSVVPVENRVGQLLYNRLLDRMNPEGAPGSPRFRLIANLVESTDRVGFQKNEFATRANLRLRASFTLQAISTGAVLRNNNSNVVASYNILNSDFATLASESEARRRAARELADEITTRVSLYFASNPEVAAGAASP